MSGEKIFCIFETWRPQGGRARNLRLTKQAALTTAPGPSTVPFLLINLTAQPQYHLYDVSTIHRVKTIILMIDPQRETCISIYSLRAHA